MTTKKKKMVVLLGFTMFLLIGVYSFIAVDVSNSSIWLDSKIPERYSEYSIDERDLFLIQSLESQNDFSRIKYDYDYKINEEVYATNNSPEDYVLIGLELEWEKRSEYKEDGNTYDFNENTLSNLGIFSRLYVYEYTVTVSNKFTSKVETIETGYCILSESVKRPVFLDNNDNVYFTYGVEHYQAKTIDLEIDVPLEDAHIIDATKTNIE